MVQGPAWPQGQRMAADQGTSHGHACRRTAPQSGTPAQSTDGQEDA